jgi:hypothetical protein
MKRPAHVSDLLASLFRGKPIEQRLHEGKIWLVWDASVGPQIAAKARPLSFRDGILSVAVTSAPWMQQLTFLKKGIIEKLNEQLNRDLVRDIYLKAGMEQPPSPKLEPGKKPRRLLTEEEQCRIREQTATINNPELQEAFVTLLTKHLSGNSADSHSGRSK